jgi:hypothetical protein
MLHHNWLSKLSFFNLILLTRFHLMISLFIIWQLWSNLNFWTLYNSITSFLIIIWHIFSILFSSLWSILCLKSHLLILVFLEELIFIVVLEIVYSLKHGSLLILIIKVILIFIIFISFRLILNQQLILIFIFKSNTFWFQATASLI